MATAMAEPNQAESTPPDRTGSRVLDWLNRFLSHRHLPIFLALGAILVMLPALKSGLMADDLVQRSVELRPDQLPARLHDTGIPADSGSLRAVLRDLFPGVGTNPQSVAQAKNYGVLPWWTPDDMSLGLWRPLSAFTHWLDYRLFPDSPALMHAHNIAWFVAVVFLVTVIYQKLGVAPGDVSTETIKSPQVGRVTPCAPFVSPYASCGAHGVTRPTWSAGLAALLFLLDAFLYVPVMFVANRGFVMSLCFGLLCFYAHHQWRSAARVRRSDEATERGSPMMWSALFLALSLFANEGGASTLAFIFAYALVLEPDGWRRRALTVLPSVLVIVLWRTVYKFGGFGIFHVGLYIDPGTEPLAFAQVAIPRAMALLGGQITGAAPDVLFAIKPSLHPVVIVLYSASVLAALAVFLPCVRRNRIAAFWLAVTVLATIPAATVAPLSKNLGFVAIGIYGLMASFIAALVTRPGLLPERLAYRVPAWIVCGLLLTMHIPVAIAGRVVMAGVATAENIEAIASGSRDMRSSINRDKSPDVDNKNVIVVNAPCAITLAYAPFYKAYYHQPLPRTLRTLVPGCTSFDVQRTDDRTLVIQSRASNIFTCDDVGPAHFAYVFSACNVAVGVPKSKKGDRHGFDGLTVEVLEANAADVATGVAFRFDSSLDSPDFHWLWWDWQTFSYKPFALPAIGQSVTLSGPAHRADNEGKKVKNE
jgi:hypothetical protein